MKKIQIIILLALFVTGFVGCKDNMDYSSLHNLTDEEKAEIARQDSIEEAEKNRINANLILKYTAEITVSKTLYDGVTIPIGIDSIANLFKISEAELLAGIAGEAGAPEVKPFAIDWSTRADVGTATNTNAPWGHWWDVNGDVTTWGDATKLANAFCEFDTEAGAFVVGQFPDRLVAGDTIKIIEALKYNELRVAVVITILPVAPEEYHDPETPPTGNPEALTVDITLEKEFSTDYANVTSDVKEIMRNAFKMTTYQIHQAIASGDLKLYQGAVSETAPAYTADAPGYWLKADGTVGSWGQSALVWVSLGHAETELYLYGGNHPVDAKPGDVVTTTYIATCNGGSVTFNITFKIKGDSYVDPETPPTGTPEALSLDVALEKAYSNDYASVTADVKDILRNAFKMTTYQIHQAITSGELKLYQGAVGETAPAYSADVPGYWLKADGTVGQWADGLVWVSLGHTKTELYLYGGNHPDNATTGNTVTTTYIATCNGGSVTFKVTFAIK